MAVSIRLSRAGVKSKALLTLRRADKTDKPLHVGPAIALVKGERQQTACQFVFECIGVGGFNNLRPIEGQGDTGINQAVPQVGYPAYQRVAHGG